MLLQGDLLLGECHGLLLSAVMQVLVSLVDGLGIEQLLLKERYQLVHGSCQCLWLLGRGRQHTAHGVGTYRLRLFLHEHLLLGGLLIHRLVPYR